MTQRTRLCLWFDDQAEQAAQYYTGIFRNSRIEKVTRYGKAGFEQHRRPEGSVMTVEFELAGQRYMALNGGPHFKFNEAISIEVHCETQLEVDYFWDSLSAGGDPKAQQCGWLKDKYGLSWQVVPTGLARMFDDEQSPRSQRAFEAMMKMKKPDIAAIERAYNSGA